MPRPDAMLMTMEDLRKQRALRARRRRGVRYGRVRVPPTLVIESVSIDHEAYDEVTKRGWYAEANIPNYWLLNAYRQSLQCLVLDGPDYRVDQTGRGKAKLRPSAFPGLVIPLADLWA